MTGRNLVVCCDGTGNEYRTRGATNVVRLYRALTETSGPGQYGFYDPGLGTFADKGAVTGITKKATMLAGLAFGYGIKQNLADAYRFLMAHYQPGDRVFLFGFSRGAYTVRALAGMLQHVGLLQPQHDNLIDYALRIFWKRTLKDDDWHLAASFKKTFARDLDIAFLGVWDTVKSIGWFRRRLILPYTAKLPNITAGRHAISIDERRSQYRPNLWSPDNSDAFQQVWFAGVHSDIGGTFPDDHRLADLTLTWIADAARTHGLELDDIPPPAEDAWQGRIHHNLWPFWWILGWRRRRIPNGSWIHPSVRQRAGWHGYTPPLPDNAHPAEP
jgi:uncharacterized protein (DUF2235 family)